MGRAISIDQLFKRKRKLIGLHGEWLERIGNPEVGATIFIQAPTGSGKSTFVAGLVKDLAPYGRIGYVSAEEGDSESLRLAFKRVGMQAVRRKVVVYDSQTFDEVEMDLDKHKSPAIVVIDTIQFFEMTKKQYTALKKKYPLKTFIWISHMDGNKPDGSLALHIWRDAGIKITVEGFVAFIRTSRYGGSLKPYVIWEKGAQDYHGMDFLTGFKQEKTNP